MLDPGIGALIIVAVAMLLLTASVHKWRELGVFAVTLRAYRLMPDAAVLVVAPLVAAVEAALGTAMLIPRARPAAAIAGAALLGLYAAAIAINLVRGRRDLDCGCGGREGRRPIAPWMVTRNLLLAAALVLAALPWARRPLTGVDAVTVVGGVAVLSMIYAAIDRLILSALPRSPPLRSPS
jgi:hypothetical protein